MVVMILLALIFLFQMVGLEIEQTQQLLPEYGEEDEEEESRRRRRGEQRRRRRSRRRNKSSNCHPVNKSLLFSSSRPVSVSVRPPMGAGLLSPRSQQPGRDGAALLWSSRRCPRCWSPAADVSAAATCRRSPRSMNRTLRECVCVCV